MIKKLAKYAIIILVVAAALAAMFLYSIRDVKVVGASIDEIKDLSISGFSLGGRVRVYNGGFLPIRVDRITYNVTLGEVKGVLGKGALTGGTVNAKQTKDFVFDVNVEWVPSIDTAIELLLANKTYADVRGIVHVLEYKGLVKLKIPFSARVNLKGYIEHLVMESPSVELDGMMGDVAGIIGDIAEGVSEELKKDAAGFVIEKIGNIS